MSLPALRYEQARYLVVGRVRVRSQVVSDEDLSHRQQSGTVGGGIFLEERSASGRKVNPLEAPGNLGAAINQHRPTVRAPLGKSVRLRERRHRLRLSSHDRVKGVFSLWSARQNELPV